MFIIETDFARPNMVFLGAYEYLLFESLGAIP